MPDPTAYRFYTDLAPWWPLISPPHEYAEEAAEAGQLLRRADRPVRDVLELGSGGGHNAHHLQTDFDLTLVDLSADMIAVSRALNPDLTHHVADMRTLRLDRTFDAVFIHDAIDYMTTEADLRAALTTAWEHCRRGGLTLLCPDSTRETYQPATEHGGSDTPDGRGARYLQWDYDPDPTDTLTTSQFTFTLRSEDDRIDVIHETHHTGLFATATWLQLLRENGFRPQSITENTTDDRPPRTFFLAHRPW